MKTLISAFAFFFLVFAPQAALASMEKDATAFVDKMGKETISVISNKSLTQKDREKQFERIFTRYFDVNTIARFVMGRHWNNATKSEQDEYLKLFKDMVVRMYAERFGEYTNEELVVRSAFARDNRDVFVNSEIVFGGGRPPIAIEWRVRKRDNNFKVVDVSIEGISMSITQRSDFGSIIDNNGGKVEALLTQMRSRVASN